MCVRIKHNPFFKLNSKSTIVLSWLTVTDDVVKVEIDY